MHTPGFVSPVPLASAAILGMFALAPLGARAAAVPFTGALTFTLGTQPLLQGPVITGSGVAGVNGSGGSAPLVSVALPVGAFDATVTGVVTDPLANPIAGLRIALRNSTGTVVAGTGGLGGLLRWNGVLKVCLQVPCPDGPVANLPVPLSVMGVGGTSVQSFFVNVTVTGAPWTTGAVSFAGGTTAGFAHGPLSVSATAATPGGSLALVTPVFISTSVPSLAFLPSAARLEIAFVPEPQSALFFAAALAGVVLARRGARVHGGR